MELRFKFHENIAEGLIVTERTRNDDGWTDGQTDGQSDYYRAIADFVWRGRYNNFENTNNDNKKKNECSTLSTKD